MKTKRVIVLGAGGNCRDIVDTMLDINLQAGRTLFEPVGYLDDAPGKKGARLGGFPVLGPLDHAADYADCHFVYGINGTLFMARKRAILEGTGIPRERFVTLVHPSAAVSTMARVGAGVVILQNVSVCSEARIGDHVMILPNTAVCHDAEVGDLSYLTAGVILTGYVRLEEAVYMGAGASVRCRATIGARAIVGMGSVVLEDVPPESVVAGVPARPIRKLQN